MAACTRREPAMLGPSRKRRRSKNKHSRKYGAKQRFNMFHRWSPFLFAVRYSNILRPPFIAGLFIKSAELALIVSLKLHI